MKAVDWLVGFVSGICITSAIVVFAKLHFYKVEINTLKNDVEIQQAAGRGEIEAIREQFSRALRLCNSKLEAVKVAK